MTLDAAWRELEADALASDGPIRDADVKDAIRRQRPHIDAAARAALLDRLIERVRTMPPNGVIARWENVSRSAVIDILLAERVAMP